MQQAAASGDLSVSSSNVASENVAPSSGNGMESSGKEVLEQVLMLSSLPVGARLMLRCRKDWRDATVAAVAPDQIILSVGAPSGRTYRVRRPPDSPLTLDGSIPILGTGAWRVGLARYDTRW